MIYYKYDEFGYSLRISALNYIGKRGTFITILKDYYWIIDMEKTNQIKELMKQILTM